MPSEPLESDSHHAALLEALQAIVRPLARLAVARGVPFAAVEDSLKRGFVEAARDALPDPAASRTVSRISTATGINRREVTRLCEAEPAQYVRPRTLATEVFAHWTTARDYRDRRGRPRVLHRQGPGATFETLAESVTRDVHPRSLLDELVRLGLATHDEERDTVTLRRDAFVPHGDVARMLEFLGDNVGDHLSAAVHNVLTDGQHHFEQAVFADAVSSEALQQVREAVREQWQRLVKSIVPMLERTIDEDIAKDRVRDQRVRIGLYTFNEAAPASASARGHRKRKDST